VPASLPVAFGGDPDAVQAFTFPGEQPGDSDGDPDMTGIFGIPREAAARIAEQQAAEVGRLIAAAPVPIGGGGQDYEPTSIDQYGPARRINRAPASAVPVSIIPAPEAAEASEQLPLDATRIEPAADPDATRYQPTPAAGWTSTPCTDAEWQVLLNRIMYPPLNGTQEEYAAFARRLTEAAGLGSPLESAPEWRGMPPGGPAPIMVDDLLPLPATTVLPRRLHTPLPLPAGTGAAA
jgi:hypothetical protein